MPDSWLTPYIQAWIDAFEGSPAYGPLAKYLSPLHKAYGLEEVLARWRAYLKEANPMYANPARFSQTYGAWKPKQTHKDLRGVQ
jgi:hypothetical protein